MKENNQAKVNKATESNSINDVIKEKTTLIPGGLFTIPMWLIFSLTLLLSVCLYFIFKDRFFCGYPKLTDLIVDNIVIEGSNKTGELNLFWCITAISCLFCLFLFILSKRDVTFSFITSIKEKLKSHELFYRAILYLPLFIPAITLTIFYTKNILFLWLFSCVFYISILYFKENASDYIPAFLFLYFDIHVITCLLSLSHIFTVTNDLLIFILAIAFFVIFIFSEKIITKKMNTKKVNTKNMSSKNNAIVSIANLMLILQFPLPLLLLLYLKNTYQIGESTTTLSYPVSYMLCIIFFILLLYGLTVWEWNNGKKKQIKNNIFFSSIAAIFLYGSYMPTTLMVPSDLHHYGEQMLPFQQIVGLSMKTYDGYAPVSGLFPMIPGFINQVLFHNKATTFYCAFVITMILFAFLILALMRLHIDGEWLLLFAFIFHMPTYCRTWIFIPVLLLWMLPKLLKQPRRFLYVYVFTSFLAGLYYPLFGAALVCGGLPTAFSLLITYFKNRDIKTECKTKSFYTETILMLIPILVSIPLLIKMASHVFAYSGQTPFADGLSLCSIEVPEWFMPLLSHGESLLHVRNVLYYMVRFLTPAIVLWIPLLLLFYYMNKMLHITRHSNANIKTTPEFLGLFSGLILLPICYTYTLVIMDESWVSKLFSRSGHIYLWIFGMLIPIVLLKYSQGFISSHFNRVALISICISIGMISFSDMRDYQFPVIDGTTNSECAVVGEYTKNLQPFYIPDDVTMISDRDNACFERLGNGYIQSDVLSEMYKYQNNLAIIRLADPDAQVLGLNGQQLYYFLLDEKAPYSGKISLAKSMKAATCVLPFISEHTIVGSDIKNLNNYPIYRELLDKGFVYDPVTEFYLSKSIYTNLYGEETYADCSHTDTPFSAPVYLAKMPSVLAENLIDMSEQFVSTNSESDFLYVSIDPKQINNLLSTKVNADTILCIEICDQDKLVYMLADYCNGTLLLPLGMNEYYHLHPDAEIFISIFEGNSEVSNSGFLLKDVCDIYRFYQYNIYK